MQYTWIAGCRVEEGLVGYRSNCEVFGGHYMFYGSGKPVNVKK
jgi:hypothetical protein